MTTMKTHSISIGSIARIVLITASVIWLFFAQGCSLFSKKYAKTESEEYKLYAIGKESFSFENTNGKINIKNSDNDSIITIKIRATIYTKKEDVNKENEYIKLKIDSTGKNIKVKTDILNERGFFVFELHGSNKTEVDIYLPAKMIVKIDNTNGDIKADGLNNESDLQLTNGDISLDNVTGKMKIEITNGSLKCAMDSIKTMNADVTNGKIEFTIGKAFSAGFDMGVVNGKISLGDNIPGSNDSKNKRSYNEKIGNSDSEVKARVTNGKISLSYK